MIIILAVLTLMIALYFFAIRPWQTTWGATKEEVQQVFVDDDVVTKPHFVATRAITINAQPSEVWGWIIQIGSARAGFYSYIFYHFGDIVMNLLTHAPLSDTPCQILTDKGHLSIVT
jgi:hypothetical protein